VTVSPTALTLSGITDSITFLMDFPVLSALMFPDWLNLL
jgi:hypothetical protein